MPRGRFITFEGGEGVGKSTQARLLGERLLAARLQAGGIVPVLTREPGGTPFAEEVRELLLGADRAPREALAETLLFYAARADHLARVIRPALDAGKWVISDRFSDSTRVYQGLVGEVAPDVFVALERLVVAPTVPDLTFMLDIPAEEGLRRAEERRLAAAGRGRDPYEARRLDFHEQLRAGFLELAAREPDRCVVINATGEPGTVAARVWAAVERRLLGCG
jgi:dTMP kinase